MDKNNIEKIQTDLSIINDNISNVGCLLYFTIALLSFIAITLNNILSAIK